MAKGLQWIISNGKDIDILPDGRLSKVPADSLAHLLQYSDPRGVLKKVSQLIDEHTLQWDWAIIRDKFPPWTWPQFGSAPRDLVSTDDNISWTLSSTNTFTVKTAYLSLNFNDSFPTLTSSKMRFKPYVKKI